MPVVSLREVYVLVPKLRINDGAPAAPQVASSEVRLASGCPGKHGKSGCHVDERFHFTAIRAVKAVTMSYVPANTV